MHNDILNHNNSISLTSSFCFLKRYSLFYPLIFKFKITEMSYLMVIASCFYFDKLKYF